MVDCVTGELEALQGVMGSGEDGQVVSRLVSKVAILEAAAGQAEAQRRALHNQLVELRGNVRPQHEYVELAWKLLHLLMSFMSCMWYAAVCAA